MFHPEIDADAVTPPDGNALAEVGGFLRGVLTLPALALPRHPPRGGGSPVRVVPGYMSGDWSTVAIRAYLKSLGYDAKGWGLGTNRGDVRRYADDVIELVRQDVADHGEPVRLVGWSLGGVISREVAREVPDLVHQVVTMGTPVVGGPKYTLAAKSYAEDGWDLEEIAEITRRRNEVRIEVPVTAVYSRADRVVAWQSCLDPNLGNDVRHVEVDVKHAEFGFSPGVLRGVARVLAPPTD